MSTRFLLTLGTLLVIGVIAGLAIFLAKGYTFSTTTGRIQGTGIMSVTSLPEGATVYLDGHLNTATNATINSLTPKSYAVRVVKEGFIPWEKKIEVKEGLVTDVKVTLFPAIPTIYPLTFNGVVNPLLSPDGQRLAFAVPVATVSGTLKQKGGIWVWNMVSQPIAFVRGGEPHQLVASTTALDFTQATLRFSPDSKQLLASIAGNNYLLNTDASDQNANDVTPTLPALLRSWDDDQKTKDLARISLIKDLNLQKLASSAAFPAPSPASGLINGLVRWSPDETKFMVLPTGGKGAAKIYDLDTSQEFQLPEAKAYYWLPDSMHLVLVQEGKIALVDFDGSNSAVIYAGGFLNGFAFPWPDSSRLVIINSLPTPTASQPNLYGINLK